MKLPADAVPAATISARALGRLQDLDLALAAQRYAAACRRPARTQERILRGLLRRLAPTAYGRAHRLAQVDSVAAWQATVPVVDHEILGPWLARALGGEADVLWPGAPSGARQSAGHAGAPRQLPSTAALRLEVGRAVRPWLAGWLRACPALARAPLYWDVAALAPAASALPADTGDPALALGGIAGLAVARRRVAPPAAGAPARAPYDLATLHALVAAADLAAIIGGNPLQLLALARTLVAQLDLVLAALAPARAAAVRAAIARHGHLTAQALWPSLQVVGVWRDGPAAPLLAPLAHFFGAVPLRQVPLATQEGVLTVPGWAHATGAPLAVDSHFCEFRAVDGPRRPPLLAHQLARGGLYEPVLTTGAGLPRVRLGDVVRCTGHRGELPLLAYVDKAAASRGDGPLTPQRLQQALEEARSRLGLVHRFALCVPLPPPHPGYCLYVDAAVSESERGRLAQLLEASLARDPAYFRGRRQGAIRPLAVVPVTGGWQRYEQLMAAGGLPPGTIKPTVMA